jgi:glutamate racemase
LTHEINSRSPIGVFDSGIGGLTVLKEIYRYLPAENVIYLGDTARVPYGPRPLEEVKKFVLEISGFLHAQGVKLIVIACNTGTAAGLQSVAKLLPVPVIGVIDPGAKAAVNTTKTGRIGVIGTAGTINSKSYDAAIKKIDKNIEIVSAACPIFVEYVEKGETDSPELVDLAKFHLAQLIDSKVDTLILGCTHYPLIKDLISEAMGKEVSIISSAEETAKEIARLGLSATGAAANGKSRFLATADPEDFKLKGSRFLGRAIETVEHLSIEDLSGSILEIPADIESLVE